MKLMMLLANQRSGTNALRSALRTDPTIADAREIFSRTNPRGAHVTFAELIRESPAFIPDRTTLRTFFDRLLEELQQTHSPGQLGLIDIKYNSFGPFNPYGWRVSEEPYFLTYFKRRKLPIVHLIRRNMLAAYVSALRAVKTQHWHQTAASAEEVPAYRIYLEKREFIGALKIRVEELRLMKSFVQSYERHIEIYYEDLFEGDSLSESIRRSISELAAHPIEGPLQTEHRKIPWQWQEAILNFDEMKSWIEADPLLKVHCHEFL